MQVESWWYDALEKQAGESPQQYPELPWREMLRQIREKIGRRFMTQARRQRIWNDRAVADVFAGALKAHLLSQKQAGRAVIAVLSPPPGEPTLSPEDGYMRRVCAVDQNILFDQERVYFYDSPYWDVNRVRVRQLDTALYAVYYNSRFAAHRSFLREMISLCRVCYIQSIWRLLPHNMDYGEIPPIFDCPGVEYALDLHGTVPEELRLEGEDERADTALDCERLCLRNCQTVVGVNAASRAYIDQQHPAFSGRFVVCPFFPLPKTADESEKAEGPITVLYAGGGQAWQLLDEMTGAIAVCPNRELRYELYVHGISDSQRAQLAPPGRNCITGVLSPEALAERYRAAQYGFLLRDDTPVNRYATPTKLLEYLQYGVVPIVKSAEIGDFAAQGMQYIPLERFKAGLLPDRDTRNEMARKNYDVARRILAQTEAGVKALREQFRCEQMKY